MQLDECAIAPEPEPLLAVPPIFVKEEDAITYQFRSFYGADPPSLKIQGKASFLHLHVFTRQLRF